MFDSFVVAQLGEPLSGGAGWLGAGLLGAVLAWVFLKHLPDKDKQLKDLIDSKDTAIREITDRHSDVIKRVVENCEREASKEREASERRHAESIARLDKIHETGRDAVHATRNLSHTISTRNRLADAFQSTELPAWTKHLDGTITSWNLSAERLLGWKQGEIVGHSVFETLIPAGHSQEQEHEVMKRIAAGEAIDEYETDRVRKGGRIIRLLVVTSPIRNQAGKVVGASTIAREA